jgi:hypothetical protein
MQKAIDANKEPPVDLAVFQVVGQVPEDRNNNVSKEFKNFCGNIINTASDDERNREEEIQKVITVLQKTKTDDTVKYVRCEGTTTVFGNKLCVQRQCRCVTKNQLEPFDPNNMNMFATSEKEILIAAIAENKLKSEYQLCNRHSSSIRLPFEYLKRLDLVAGEIESDIRGGILEIRKSSYGGDTIDGLLDNILTLIPFIANMGRENAHDARSSVKRALDDFILSEDEPAKLQKIEEVYTSIHTAINQGNQAERTEIRGALAVAAADDVPDADVVAEDDMGDDEQ